MIICLNFHDMIKDQNKYIEESMFDELVEKKVE